MVREVNTQGLVALQLHGYSLRVFLVYVLLFLRLGDLSWKADNKAKNSQRVVEKGVCVGTTNYDETFPQDSKS